MIVKIPLVLAIVNYMHGVSCASFSKVLVQKGPDPVDYVQYGAPSVPYSPHIAQLTAAPVGSVVPYATNYVPCGTPCVYPGQVASVAPSTNVVQYQSPSLPVVVSPARNDRSGYEYSYVVYDEQTGDHKAQHEQSDGSSVRGGYSFLQPDGLIREVQYVADDTQGFNAVVKNYLPVESKTHDSEQKPEVDPCLEVKNDKSNDEPSKHADQSYANLILHKEHAPQVELHDNKGYHETNSGYRPAVENHEVKHEASAEPSKEDHIKPLEVYFEVEEQHEIHEKPHEIHQVAYENHHKETHDHAPEYHKVQDEPAVKVTGKAVAHNNVPAVQDTHVAIAEHNLENSNVLVSYNDIIRCIQSSLSGVRETTSSQKPESPLTYIILNKPCYLNKI